MFSKKKKRLAGGLVPAWMRCARFSSSLLIFLLQRKNAHNQKKDGRGPGPSLDEVCKRFAELLLLVLLLQDPITRKKKNVSDVYRNR
jgi:hypothetical protein